MNSVATLHRYVYILRRLKKPYNYPNKSKLVDELRDKGFLSSTRTFERDIQMLQDEYGIHIHYHRQKRGYYWELPEDEDIAHFDTFLQLLERKERLDFLSPSNINWFDTSRYLLLENNTYFQGTEKLPQIWEALQTRRVITFKYQSYEQAKPKSRRVEPNLIVEERNRWYLVGWDVKAKSIRSFGLDRMDELQLTKNFFIRDISKSFREQKIQIIGMTIHPELQEEEVILRFSSNEAPYVLAAPLHVSQKVIQETETYVDLRLQLKLNYELEREILGYGEEVEVIKPIHLREKIKDRLSKAMKVY